jgi:hypothetical protein
LGGFVIGDDIGGCGSDDENSGKNSGGQQHDGVAPPQPRRCRTKDREEAKETEYRHERGQGRWPKVKDHGDGIVLTR